MNSWLIGVVSLVVGGVIGFMYAQGEAGDLKDQVSKLQAEMSEKVSSVEKQMSDKVSGLEAELAKAKKDAETATAELSTFKTDVGEKAKEIDELKAKIQQLEASSSAAPAPPASTTPPPPGQPRSQ